jgi:ketosteroid isomerase-like protein
MSMSSRVTPKELASRLCDATNAHDLDGIVACFAADYRNETPAHPARGFSGREQVRRNWEQIFTFVPDLRAELLGCSTDGHTVWTEWEHSGTRPDGSTHRMRGVIIFDVSDGLMSAARFYLEPVDATETDADAAVRRQVNPTAAR